MKPTLIVFVGGMGGSEAEDMVAAAHHASTVDTVTDALATGAFDGCVVVTDAPLLVHRLPAGCQVEITNQDFHFGRTLLKVVKKHRIQCPVYVGGGSLPLFPAKDLAATAHRLAQGPDGIITNNLFSSDLVAFKPAAALEHIDLPASDNSLAQVLRLHARLECTPLPRTATTQFDIDTPTDLLILKLYRSVRPNLRRFLDSLAIDPSPVQEAIRTFTDPAAEVVVGGRVGSQVWALLERDTACRVRLFSEERGMKADGREQHGAVRSLMGFHVEAVGAERFFQTLGKLGDAAFIDSRVIFSHLHLNASQADRFNSDLMRVEDIQAPAVREFTSAALEAPIPIVLGGHSLVSGGLMVLIDLAWLMKEGSL